MPLPPLRDQPHANTEPSTPLRTRAPTNTSISVPLSVRSRLSFVNLPPDDLSLVVSRQSSSWLRRPTKDTTLQKLKRLGLHSHNSSVLLSRRTSRPNSKTGSEVSTPRSRRLSDHLTVRRKRRSSTGTTYVSGYHGPITKDFLRAFSRALVHDQRETFQDYESERVFQALDHEHRLQSHSPQDHTNYSEFDHSLPLPSDDAMRSPPQATVNVSSSPVGTPRIEAQKEEKRPAFKSYLERILESRRHASIFDQDTAHVEHEDEDIEGVHDIITTSKFVIENTIQGLPEFSDDKESYKELDIRLAEPLVVDSNAIRSESEESSEGDYKVPELTRPKRTHRSSMDLQKTPEYETFDYEDAKGFDESQLDSMLRVPENYDSPPTAVGVDDDLDNAPHHPSSDLGLILGHFTIDNEDLEDLHAFQLQPGLLLSDNEKSLRRLEDQQAKSQTRRISNLSGVKRSRSTSTLPIPKNLIKGAVNSVNHLSPTSKRPKNTRLSPSLLQTVLKCSNDFLGQVLLTLEAYAEHRGADSIGIQDAVLYLNRVKTPLASSEMERVAKLAHNLFPLETLVSLDNNLQQSTLRKFKQMKMKEEINEMDVVEKQESFLKGARTRETSSYSTLSIDDDTND